MIIHISCKDFWDELITSEQIENRLLIIFIDRELKIIKFRGDPSKMGGFCEIRGIVNKDGTMSYGEYT